MFNTLADCALAYHDGDATFKGNNADQKTLIQKFKDFKYKSVNALLSVIEDKHDCSGFCTPSLFYFTKKVSEGPPKDACLAKLAADIGPSLNGLGNCMVLSGVIFLLLPLCALPICCWRTDDEEEQKDVFTNA